MSLSLREQLLQAGLGTKKQAEEAERQERARQHSSRVAGRSAPQQGQPPRYDRTDRASAPGNAPRAARATNSAPFRERVKAMVR